MPDNVIQGPWGKKAYAPNSEDIQTIMSTDKLVNELSDALFDGIRQAGFDNFNDLVYSKDYALIVGSLRSALYKLQTRYDPLQEIAEHLFTYDNNGMLIMNYSLNVELE